MKTVTAIIFLVLALFIFSALQPASPQTGQPLDQRIGAQIGALVIQGVALQVQVEKLQADLKTAQDRIKALEDKYEPKKDAPK